MQPDLKEIARRLETIANDTRDIARQLWVHLDQTKIQLSVAESAESTVAGEVPATTEPTFEEKLAVTITMARAKLTTPELRAQLLAELAKLGLARVSEANVDQLKQITVWIEAR